MLETITDCTSTVENTFFNLNNYDNWNFTNVASKELVVTPYGAFDAYKVITSHSKLHGYYWKRQSLY